MVDVLLERTEDREGHMVLSREKAEKMKIWDEVEKAYADRKASSAASSSEPREASRWTSASAHSSPARSRRPSRPQPRCAEGAGAPDARHQGQQEARQHRPLAQGAARGRERREEETTLETLAEGKVLRGTVKNITD